MVELTEKQKNKLADTVSAFISRLLSETPSLKTQVEVDGKKKVELGTCKVMLRAISEREYQTSKQWATSQGIREFLDMVLNTVKAKGLPEDQVLNYLRYVLMLRINELEEGVTYGNADDTLPDMPKPGR